MTITTKAQKAILPESRALFAAESGEGSGLGDREIPVVAIRGLRLIWSPAPLEKEADRLVKAESFLLRWL